MYDKSIETIVNGISSEIHYYLSRKYPGLTDSGINNIVYSDTISTDINKIISLLVDIHTDVENLVSFYYERENIE